MIKDAIPELHLDKDKPNGWKEEELQKLATQLRKKTKPMIIACNKADIPGSEKTIQQLQLKFPDYIFIPCSAESELALKEADKAGLIEYIPGEKNFIIKNQDDLTEKQQKALSFIKENILAKYHSTGVQNVLDESIFNLLKYIAIFPGGMNKLEDSDGNVLPDCFLLPQKSTALDFAYKLHTDFGKKFICAKDVKTKMTVGKDHTLKHRGVIEIVAGK